jgi:hypothetical protein
MLRAPLMAPAKDDQEAPRPPRGRPGALPLGDFFVCSDYYYRDVGCDPAVPSTPISLFLAYDPTNQYRRDTEAFKQHLVAARDGSAERGRSIDCAEGRLPHGTG